MILIYLPVTADMMWQWSVQSPFAPAFAKTNKYQESPDDAHRSSEQNVETLHPWSLSPETLFMYS